MTDHSTRQAIPILTGSDGETYVTSAVCDLIAAYDAAALVPCALSLSSRTSPSAEYALRLWASTRGLAIETTYHEARASEVLGRDLPAFRLLRCTIGKPYSCHEITIHLYGAGDR